MKMVKKETTQTLLSVLLMPLFLLLKTPQEQEVLRVMKRKTKDSMIEAGNFKFPGRTKISY